MLVCFYSLNDYYHKRKNASIQKKFQITFNKIKKKIELNLYFFDKMIVENNR